MGWQGLRMDLRYALRTFARTPVFTVLTVLTLALGIGANSAIFTVVHSVLLKPLPYANPDRLLMVWNDNTREGVRRYPMSPANALDVKAATRTLQQVEVMYSFLISLTMRTDAGTEQLTAAGTSPGIFSLLGRQAAIGRTMQPGDPAGVMVLSDGFWRRRFGGDTGVVGRQINVDGRPAVVLGVMPPDFHFPLKSMLGPSGFSAIRGARCLDADRHDGFPVLTERRSGAHDALSGSSRAARARRNGRAGAARDLRDHRPARAAVPGGEPRSRDECRRAPRAGRRTRTSRARAAPGGCRIRAADRLRQRRQSAAGPQRCPPEGNRSPHRTRGGTEAAARADARRESLALECGRNPRPRVRVDWCTAVGCDGAAGAATFERGAPGHHHRDVHGGDLGARRRFRGNRAGDRSRSRERAGRAQGRGAGRRRRRGAAADSRRARHRRGRAGSHADGRRRTPAAQLRDAACGRSRLPRREPAHAADQHSEPARPRQTPGARSTRRCSSASTRCRA